MKKLFLYILLILATLFLRDLPYFNVLFIHQLWIVYFILLLILLFTSIKFDRRIVVGASFFLLLVALVLTLLKMSFFADAVGVFLYFLLWFIAVDAARQAISKD